MKSQRSEQKISLKGIDVLLKKQTTVVKELIFKTEQRIKAHTENLMSEQATVILTAVDQRLENMEARINNKIEKLITILDTFLKRLTDTEQEFTIMKADINKIKSVMREKLGIPID